MTTNKSKKGFVWSEAKPTKMMRPAEYCQSLHDAKFQHADYRKKTPFGESGFINPQFRSSSGNTANFQEFQLQPISEKLKARVNGYRHSKLNT